MEKPIGTTGKWSITLKDGKAKVEAQNDFGIPNVGAWVEVPADELLDQLAAAIPGTFDDALIAIAKEALKKL